MSTGSIWTGAFWKAAAERAISTFAQSTAASAIVINFADINATMNTLEQALGIGATAALLSVLKSVGFGLGTGGSPSRVEIPPANVGLAKAQVEEKIDRKVDQALIAENERQARLADNKKEN